MEDKIQKLTEEKVDKFPCSPGDVVIVRAASNSFHEIKAVSGCWGIIKEVDRISYSILIYNGGLDEVRSIELEPIDISSDLKKSAINLMNRLQKIAEFEIVDPIINDVLLGICKRQIFALTSAQNQILKVVEKELGII